MFFNFFLLQLYYKINRMIRYIGNMMIDTDIVITDPVNSLGKIENSAIFGNAYNGIWYFFVDSVQRKSLGRINKSLIGLSEVVMKDIFTTIPNLNKPEESLFVKLQDIAWNLKDYITIKSKNEQIGIFNRKQFESSKNIYYECGDKTLNINNAGLTSAGVVSISGKCDGIFTVSVLEDISNFNTLHGIKIIFIK